MTRESAGRINRAWVFTCFWLAVAAFGGVLGGRFIERTEHRCSVEARPVVYYCVHADGGIATGIGGAPGGCEAKP